jgi:Signal transduction histidine kinase
MTNLEVALAFAVFALVAALVVVVIALRRAQLERRAALASRAAALDARERVAELAAGNERIRILREMHDVIAHSLAIMIAQADGGSYVVEDQAAAKRALTTIAETGRAALADTRRILGILRHGETEEPTLSPAGDARIDDLVMQARTAGMEVSLVRVGEARPLPSGTQMARYRICQEALTNVMKHAGAGARVTVTESWRADDLALTITDAGGDRSSSVTLDGEPLAALGLGLIGMRERAELVGGSCQSEPTDDGYQVRAVLPFRLPGEETE